MIANNINGCVREFLRLWGRSFANLVANSVLRAANMFLHPCSTFSVSWLRAAVCRISAHSCPSYGPLAFALNSYIVFFVKYHQIAFETWSKFDGLFSFGEAKTRENMPPAGRLQRSPPEAPPAGPPHQPGGGRGYRP